VLALKIAAPVISSVALELVLTPSTIRLSRTVTV
jgi:hypothetical protein